MSEKEMNEIGHEVAKQKRPKRSKDLQVQTEPGDNRKYLEHSIKLANLTAIDVKNNSKLEQRIFEYFSICAEDDMKPSVAGLALAIGTDRRRLWEWAQTEKSERSDTIKKAYQILDLQMTDYMQNGKINPVSGIFLMKNNFGYKDQQDVVIKPEAPLGEIKDENALREQYIDSVVDELPPSAENP